MSLASALGVTASLATFGGADFASAAVTSAKSLVDLIDQRSPGERVAGELIKTKHARESADDQEELTAVLAPAESVAPTVDATAGPTTEPASAFPPEVAWVIPPDGAGTPPGGGVVITPPPGGGIVPPSGPPGPPGGPPGPPPPPAPPPPALPEPGTWLTMILGFGLAGCLLRRNRAAERLRITTN